ncbi:hypothetical protein EG345_06335 [Chryseobacterium carnipullorum]|nr:hypothetical protein EG345_06335 [Chryseobacterium carnipullorum]
MLYDADYFDRCLWKRTLLFWLFHLCGPILQCFQKGLKFMISWWGACFSTGALANASLKYAFISKDPMVRDVAGAMLALLVVLITITAYLSLRNLFSGKLLRPS